ncbi:MAG: efflux RND transporter periplasmic adaptor subunit [Flavitalea sp.]
MNTIFKLTAASSLILFFIACGNASKDSLSQKKATLEELKKNQTKMNDQVVALEDEIAKEDTASGKKVNAKLVVITPIILSNFTHFIDLQGKIDANNIAYVAPRGQGGQVKAVYVKQGDNVKKGQLLLKLDNAVVQQQIDQVKVQLALAETLYQRRKNLWDQKIGTEVELIQAKSNVDNINKQIALLNEQQGQANVYAQFSGVADMVNIKVGEFYSAQSAATNGIRIVNTNTLKVIAQVPENYLHKVDVGANIEVTLPDINKTINSKVSVKGSTIDANSRSFYIEAKLPQSKDFRPNQIAMVKIQDYAAKNAVKIPMNTLQTDEKGKFVMVAATENGKMVAKKRPIEVGELYGNDLEVRSGLQANDSLITDGFQGLYDGQAVTTKII